MKTRDKDIREFLHTSIKNKYKDEPNTLLIDELVLCQGDARIDIAVVDESMHGYEIKSESDTLERLSNQINVYSKVMDTVTIVAGPNHIEKIKNIVPKWWGISEVKLNSKKVMKLKVIRKTKKNPDVESMALVQLLWRDEALKILQEFNLDKGYKSKSRRVLWERLATSLPIEELKYHVRKQIRNRRDWRAGKL